MIAVELENGMTKKIWSRFSDCEHDFMIFVAKCHFHTIEACVAVNRYEAIDELELFVLRAIELLADPDVEKIDSLLHIGRKTIKQVTTKLCKDRLLSENPKGSLEITPSGQNTLETGEMIKLKNERCIFHFIDGSNEFLRIKDPENKFLIDLKSYQTGTDWSFNIACLKKCIKQTDQWKKQRQFPVEIQELIKPQTGNEINENCLIVDKAQYVNFAVLVNFDNGQPFELTAFPLSDKGHLLSQENLFFLKGRESITNVFPAVTKLPNRKQTNQSLSNLFDQFMLGDVEPDNIKIENTHIIIKPAGCIDINWSRFYWQNLQQCLFCSTISENAAYLRKVIIESQNGEFDTLNLLFKINSLVENELKDIGTYKTWLKDNNLAEIPTGKLASLAWELNNYSMAYTLAQLEDMTDADI